MSGVLNGQNGGSFFDSEGRYDSSNLNYMGVSNSMKLNKLSKKQL